MQPETSLVQTARTAIDLLWVACDHLGHCRSLDFLNHVRYTVRSRANPIVRFEKEVQAHTIKQGVSSWFAEHRKTNNYRICILAVENTDLGMDNSDIETIVRPLFPWMDRHHAIRLAFAGWGCEPSKLCIAFRSASYFSSDPAMDRGPHDCGPAKPGAHSDISEILHRPDSFLMDDLPHLACRHSKTGHDSMAADHWDRMARPNHDCPASWRRRSRFWRDGLDRKHFEHRPRSFPARQQSVSCDGRPDSI
jgi:hypothetical protein